MVADQISRAVRDSSEFDRAHSTRHRDALTGLPTLEYLNRLTIGGEPPGGRYSRPVALLYLDIDDLESINERFGRRAGDEVITHVTAVVRRSLRGADVLFRYGGDEFVVLLAQTDAPTAANIASRIEANLAAVPHAFADGSELAVSATIGIASLPADGTSFTDLLAAARQQRHHRASSDECLSAAVQ